MEQRCLHNCDKSLKNDILIPNRDLLDDHVIIYLCNNERRLDIVA